VGVRSLSLFAALPGVVLPAPEIVLIGVLLMPLPDDPLGDDPDDPAPFKAYCRLANVPPPVESEPRGYDSRGEGGLPGGLGDGRTFTVLGEAEEEGLPPVDGGGGGCDVPLANGLVPREGKDSGLLREVLEGLLDGLPEKLPRLLPLPLLPLPQVDITLDTLTNASTSEASVELQTGEQPELASSHTMPAVHSQLCMRLLHIAVM